VKNQHEDIRPLNPIVNFDYYKQHRPTTPEIPAIAGRPATVKTSGTKGTPAIASMPVTQQGFKQQQ
jgi:hypothetical protein